ncbi:MAG: orotidine-5'-phosphate decarboxylase [Sphingobacteriaceae bacterium]
MTRSQLIAQIRKKRSFLCVGLDTDVHLLPECVLHLPNPVQAFNKRIIEATQDLCVAYKPNTAFYESRGVAGWQDLVQTWKQIPSDCLSIADAKRGDIGNTSTRYAQAFFEEQSSGMSFDAITVAPYMGSDSVKPFLAFKDKWTIVLALTSNEGSADFQQRGAEQSPLFEQVIQQVQSWASPEQLMFVVGATRGEAFKTIRKIAPEHFLLVPGVGAQGGSLADVCRFGITSDCGLLVNASRSIIYASNGEDFAERAREEALRMQQDMVIELDRINF